MARIHYCDNCPDSTREAQYRADLLAFLCCDCAEVARAPAYRDAEQIGLGGWEDAQERLIARVEGFGTEEFVSCSSYPRATSSSNVPNSDGESYADWAEDQVGM